MLFIIMRTIYVLFTFNNYVLTNFIQLKLKTQSDNYILIDIYTKVYYSEY